MGDIRPSVPLFFSCKHSRAVQNGQGFLSVDIDVPKFLLNTQSSSLRVASPLGFRVWPSNRRAQSLPLRTKRHPPVPNSPTLPAQNTPKNARATSAGESQPKHPSQPKRHRTYASETSNTPFGTTRPSLTASFTYRRSPPSPSSFTRGEIHGST